MTNHHHQQLAANSNKRSTPTSIHWYDHVEEMNVYYTWCRPLIAHGLPLVAVGWLLSNEEWLVWLRLLWIIKFTLSSAIQDCAILCPFPRLWSLPSFMLCCMALELKWKNQERKTCPSLFNLLNALSVTEPIHIWHDVIRKMDRALVTWEVVS